jgi:hypothetical protein
MLPIKYVGPRPLISQHGITYKDGKEDKYIYLQVAIEILQDIDHDYEEKKSYSHLIRKEPLPQKEMDKILAHYEDELSQKVIEEEKNYEKKIQDEIQTVENMTHLSDIEKEVWINNIELMKEYRIQRAINKIYYMHCINDIKKLVLKNHIKEIDTPFDKKFWHVLETLQGALEVGKGSVDTKLEEVTTDDGRMIMKLYIKR